MPDAPERMLTVQDVADITRLSAYTIRACIRAGELRATKLRGRLRVAPGDLQEWIDGNRLPPPRNRGTSSQPSLELPVRRAAPLGGYRQLFRDQERARATPRNHNDPPCSGGSSG